MSSEVSAGTVVKIQSYYSEKWHTIDTDSSLKGRQKYTAKVALIDEFATNQLGLETRSSFPPIDRSSLKDRLTLWGTTYPAAQKTLLAFAQCMHMPPESHPVWSRARAPEPEDYLYASPEALRQRAADWAAAAEHERLVFASPLPSAPTAAAAHPPERTASFADRLISLLGFGSTRD